MICPKCGSQLSNDAERCSLCGYEFSDMSETVETPSVSNGENGVASGAKEKKKANVLGLIAGGLLLLGAFLPYASVTVWVAKVEKSLMDGGDGIFFLAVAVVAIIAATNVFKCSNTLLIVMGVLAVLLTILEAYGTFHESEYAALYSRNVGYYLTLLGSGGIIGSGIYEKVKK